MNDAAQLAQQLGDSRTSHDAAARLVAEQRRAVRALPLLGLGVDAAERVERIAAESPQRELRACRAGCSACCYLAVSITPAEAVWIASELRARHLPGEFAALCERVAQRSADVSSLTIEQRAHARQPCALLGDAGECTIHPFRPLGCRGWTAFEKTDCDAALRDAHPGHSGPMDRALWAAAGSVSEGLQAGLRDAAIDGGHYELHSALLAALLDDEAPQRWSRGEPIFSECARVRSDRTAPRC